MKLSQLELGWLTGLMEGEASFGYYGHTQRVAIEMCDEDSVHKYALLVGRICNKSIEVTEFVRPHRINRENHSTMYRVQLTGEKARIVMKFVVAHMSYRRRTAIWRALNEFVGPKVKLADLIDITKAAHR